MGGGNGFVQDSLWPGAVLGVVGGGQLGRMLAMEAKRMGYFVGVLEPERDAPAVQVADFHVEAAYDDVEAARELGRRCGAVAVEFENVPAVTVRALEEVCARVAPGARALEVAQNREREKVFLREAGFPCAEFEVVTGEEELGGALERLGGACVLKTAAWGYDGKGQRLVRDGGVAAEAWRSLGVGRAVVERWVEFVAELSVIVARWRDGRVVSFPAVENVHRNHILDVTIAPGRFEEAVAERARVLAEGVAGALGVAGLLAVEMFLLPGGELLVNELAPRPHNSGHFSMEGAETSQFEQLWRAVCGLPPGSAAMRGGAVMVNLLGDGWLREGGVPWREVLAVPGCRLHVYGKREARPGRKMGHVTVVGRTVNEALERANRVRAALGLPEVG